MNVMCKVYCTYSNLVFPRYFDSIAKADPPTSTS